jgi:hypothetical protein
MRCQSDIEIEDPSQEIRSTNRVFRFEIVATVHTSKQNLAAQALYLSYIYNETA